MLIGCSHRELELGMESSRREMKEGMTGGTRLHVLDPENMKGIKVSFKTLRYMNGRFFFKSFI